MLYSTKQQNCISKSWAKTKILPFKETLKEYVAGRNTKNKGKNKRGHKAIIMHPYI
jgi:hypothetical protein